MSLSLPQTARPVAAFVAFAWTALSFGAALTPSPVQAAEGAYYRAQLAAPAPEARPIASGVAWKCADNACTAGAGTSRPAIVCARLAKEVGKVEAFAAGGKELSAEELARCNK